MSRSAEASGATSAVRLLAVCGSLRARSSNAAVLEAFGRLAPANVDVVHVGAELGKLPHFNPDEDREPLPPSVALWRERVAWADALVFSTPEYMHALPGSFKNALDWLAGSSEIMGKPTAILHVWRGSSWALDSLKEVLATLSAPVVPDACARLSLGTNAISCEGILAIDELRAALERSVQTLTERARGSARFSPQKAEAPGA